MTTIPTAIGQFQVYADENGLYRILFPGSSWPDAPVKARGHDHSEHSLFKEMHRQLTEYFQRKRRSFDLPLSVQGTNFQRTVWDLLCEIPYGRTSSYGKLAEKLGNKYKARAVGGAAHANPLPIIIPCHRLIGADGSLTGFAGGLSIKKHLLELEASQYNV